MTNDEVRRYARLAGTPLTLILLVVILVVAFKVGWAALTAPPASERVIPCVEKDVGKTLRTSDVEVAVLNGGHTRGLAGRTASQLKSKGFVVTGAGNTDQHVSQTVVVGFSRNDPEVKLATGFFPRSTVREDPQRVDHSVQVLVGTAFKGFNAKAPTSIAVKGPVCLPSPTPSNSSSPSGSASPSPSKS